MSGRLPQNPRLELFLAMIGSVAIRLENQAAFEPLDRTSGFQVMWADHEEPWLTAPASVRTRKPARCDSATTSRVTCRDGSWSVLTPSESGTPAIRSTAGCWSSKGLELRDEPTWMGICRTQAGASTPTLPCSELIEALWQDIGRSAGHHRAAMGGACSAEWGEADVSRACTLVRAQMSADNCVCTGMQAHLSTDNRGCTAVRAEMSADNPGCGPDALTRRSSASARATASRPPVWRSRRGRAGRRGRR